MSKYAITAAHEVKSERINQRREKEQVAATINFETFERTFKY